MLILSSINISFANIPLCRFEHFSSLDGLSHNNVAQVFVDSHGFVWICTWYGVSRFDGYDFKNYYGQRGEQGISNSRFTSVMESSDSSLWFTTYDSHFYRFNRNTEQFENIAAQLPSIFNLTAERVGVTYCDRRDNVWASYLNYGFVRIYPDGEGSFAIERFMNNAESPSDVKFIEEDSHSNIWIVDQRNNLFIISPQDVGEEYSCRKLMTLPSAVTSMAQLSSSMCCSTSNAIFSFSLSNFELQRKSEFSSTGFISAISPDVDSLNLYIGTTQGELGVLAHRGDKVQQVKADGYKSKDRIRSIMSDSHGLMWFFNSERGVNRYSPKLKDIKHFEQPNYTSSYYTDTITYIKEHKDLLIIKLNDVGFGIYDRQKDIIEPFYNDKTKPDYRTCNTVVSFDVDNDNVLWFSTYIERGFIKAQLFTDTQTELSDTGIKAIGEVRALAKDSSDNIWVGTKNGELYCFNSNREVKHLFTSKQHKGLNLIYAIKEDSKGNIWVGTKGDGLFRLTPKGESYTFFQYKHSESNIHSLSNDNVYSILEDSYGQIWVGTYGGGVNMLIDSESTRFYNQRNSFRGYPIDECSKVRYIEQNTDGDILVATTEGLVAFDPTQNLNSVEFRQYKHSVDDENSVSNNNIIHIFKDSKERLWLSTFGGGLNILNHDYTFKHYLNNHGAVGDFVMASVEDKSGNIWTLTEGGVMRFDDQTGIFTDVSDDYVLYETIEYSEATAVVDAKGYLLFGSTRGTNIIDPTEALTEDRDFDYKLIFTDLLMQNQRVEIGVDKPLSSSISENGDIVLPYDYSLFKINFASLNHTIQNRINYMYKLEGYDDSWNIIGDQNSAVYSNVPHGKYRFLLKAFVSSDEVNDDYISVNIKILPPPWKSWWAYFAYIVLILLLFFVIFRVMYIVANLRSQTKVQDDLAEMKLQFFTNISHELRTPLTLILAGLYELRKRESLTVKGERGLTLAEKNSKKMMTMVDQLLDFRKCIKNKMELRISHIDIIPIIEQVVDDFRSIASERHIELIFAYSHKSIPLWIDGERIESVVYNLLSNAFKFTPNSGRISVTISLFEVDGVAKIEVQDSGIGLSLQAQAKLFERFAQTSKSLNREIKGSGIGLALTKEIIDLHHGEISVTSGVNKGSMFSVTLLTSNSQFDMEQIDFNDDLNTNGEVEVVKKETDTVDKIEVPEDAQLILVVDDNADLRSFLNDQLSESYRVVEAADGVEALAQIEKEQPDVIITDLMMPNMDGVEFTRSVRGNFETSHIPIIMLTAKHDPNDRIKAMEYGADGYITKPFSIELLLVRIDNLVTQRRLLLEKFSTRSAHNKPAKIEAKDVVVTDLDEEFMQRLVAWIDANVEDSEITVDDLAAHMGLGRTTMYNKLKSLIGKSPIELIKEYRINKAELYLKTGQFSVSEVAYKVGFSDPSYFSRCFKDYYKLSPAEYLKQNCKN